MKKIKFPLFLLAAAIAVAGAFAATLPQKNVKKFTTYHYVSSSSDIEEMQNIVNWVDAGEDDVSCGAEGTIPCSFTYAGDLEEFGTHLQNFEEAIDLINAADTRREP